MLEIKRQAWEMLNQMQRRIQMSGTACFQTCWLLGPSDREPTWCQLWKHFFVIDKHFDLWANGKSKICTGIYHNIAFYFWWRSSLCPFPERWDSKWSSGCKSESWMVITGLFPISSLERNLNLNHLPVRLPSRWQFRASIFQELAVSTRIDLIPIMIHIDSAHLHHTLYFCAYTYIVPELE